MGIWLFKTLPLLLIFNVSCGYHIAGKANLLPRHIKTIAVVAFQNTTNEYRLPHLLSAAVTREFLSRTRYHVVADPAQGDAVLSGAVVRIDKTPAVYDPIIMNRTTGISTGTGRATVIQYSVVLQVVLIERSTNKVLYSQPNFQFRDHYEVGTDPINYLDESGPAVKRLSAKMARSIVTGILEQF